MRRVGEARITKRRNETSLVARGNDGQQRAVKPGKQYKACIKPKGPSSGFQRRRQFREVVYSAVQDSQLAKVKEKRIPVMNHRHRTA